MPRQFFSVTTVKGAVNRSLGWPLLNNYFTVFDYPLELGYRLLTVPA